jgi:hypothetical protein
MKLLMYALGCRQRYDWIRDVVDVEYGNARAIELRYAWS